MHTYRIHINGQLKDRAFALAIQELAGSFSLTGNVTAAPDKLLITCNACPETAYSFYQLILKQVPADFTISSHHMAVISKENFYSFSIKDAPAEVFRDLQPGCNSTV